MRVLSPTGEIAHERSRIERSEIGVARARIERKRNRATPKMHFRQFDANSRKLAQERRGRTTVRSRRLRGDADAEVAQNGENARARIER